MSRFDSPAPQALNHTSQCLQFWRETRMAQRVAAEPGAEHVAHALRCLEQVLWDAPKFQLPEDGRPCEDIGSLTRMFTSARLPFPTVALEFVVRANAPGAADGEAPARRRIALVSETKPTYVPDLPFIKPSVTFGRSLFVQSIAAVEHEGEVVWTPIPVVMEISMDSAPVVDPQRQSSPILTWLQERRGMAGDAQRYMRERGKRPWFETIVWPYDPRGLESPFFGGDVDKWTDYLSYNSADEVSSAISFACLSACANVSAQSLDAPAKLNRRRELAGKVPLFDVRVLTVADSGAYVSRQGRGDGSSSHASPRMHLRRGHIRTLQDSRHIWVNAAVVNAHKAVAREAPPAPSYDVQRERVRA